MTTAPAQTKSKAAELENAERALQDAEQRAGANSPELCSPIEQLAKLYHRDGLYAKAELLCRREADILNKADNGPALTQALWRLAVLLRSEGKLDESEATYLKLLSLSEQSKNKPPEYAYILSGLAGVYLSKNDLGHAEELLKKAGDVFVASCGPGNVYSHLYTVALALVCHRAGKNGEADEHFERSRLDDAAANKTAQPELKALLELVQAYYAQGRLSEGELLLQESVLGSEEQVWPDDPRVGTIWHNRGEMFRAQARFNDAEACFKQALELRQRLLGAAHPEVAASAMSLATMYLNQNRCAEAERALKCALQVRVRAFGVENPAVAACIETYVALLKRTKRSAIANKLEARARDIRTHLVSQAERPS